jgi:hypothetical protein
MWYLLQGFILVRIKGAEIEEKVMCGVGDLRGE